jgi:hypothetical protein
MAATAVDWPCRVETNFAPGNLGCRDRIVSGLTWAFEQVEEAIILEDDVLPDPTFFSFCEQMLQRYRGDNRISMIAGFNPVQDFLHTNYSYVFSQLTHIWGWATWREAWARYDQRLKDWPEIKQAGMLKEIFDSPSVVDYWTGIFDSMYDGTGPNTWDYQWMYTNLIQSTLSIVPCVNMIENIGYGADATHTVVLGDAHKLKSRPIEFPLVHPPTLIPLRSMDRRDMEVSNFRTSTPLRRVARQLKSIVTKPLTQ